VKYSFLKYSLLAVSMLGTFSLVGCSAADDLTPDATKDAEAAKLVLTLNSNTIQSKAETGDVLNGTTAESTISTIAVVFTNLNDQIEKVISYTGLTSTNRLIVLLNNAGVTLDTAHHIYLIANASSVPASGDIKTAIGTITNISDVTTANKFVMVGQATANSSTSISLATGTTVMADVALTRVVAKVVLTAYVDANGYVKNVVASDGSENGYIKAADMQYKLQTTNKSYYFIQKTNNADANYSMSDVLAKSGTTYNYKTGIYGFDNLTQWDAAATTGTAITARDDARYVTGNANPYTEGVYCLENTTDDGSSLGFTDAEKLTVARMVTTYLRIAAKFTPKYIDGLTGYSATEAAAKLTNGTFYTYTKAGSDIENVCYSSIANAKTFLTARGYTVDESCFKTFTGGLVYFNVFVNGKSFDATNSSLKRNDYYIVNVGKIYAPIIEPTMQINTKVTSWAQKGTTVVPVDTAN
jgi:hypothetical protein